MRVIRHSGRLMLVLMLFAAWQLCANAQASPEVRLTVETASPRAVEPLTEHSIVRDYAAAWKTLAEASESGSPSLINAYFVGNAKTALMQASSIP